MISTPTRWSQLSSIWKSLETWSKVWTCTKNISYIEVAPFQLPFTGSNYSIITKSPCPQSSPILPFKDIRQKLGAFKTSLSFSIEAIAGLIPINLYFQKLSKKLQLQVYSLPFSHILQSLMESRTNSLLNQHQLSLGILTYC